MSRAIDNGGPAFPTIGNIAHNSDWLSDDGMTLRDWLAGQALPAIITATSAGQHDPSAKHGKGVVGSMAADAYEIADAMIAARAKGGDA